MWIMKTDLVTERFYLASCVDNPNGNRRSPKMRVSSKNGDVEILTGPGVPSNSQRIPTIVFIKSWNLVQMLESCNYLVLFIFMVVLWIP